MVNRLISWKYSLDKINGELELARKKKQALDKLFNEGKVSQPTYESFSNEVAGAIAEIEEKQDTLVEKMKAKTSELEQQMKTLEFLLVNSEIRHVSGEIEDEAYSSECNVLSLGLETTKTELDEIKEAISNLSEKSTDVPLPTPPQVEEEVATMEPDSEKRLEIVMDTETTTSIETTVEEEAKVEEHPEVSEEHSSEQEENADAPVMVAEAEDSFRPEESQQAEANTEETQIGEETAQAQE